MVSTGRRWKSLLWPVEKPLPSDSYLEAWQISQATEKQIATSSPALSFIHPTRDVHCTVPTGQIL